jgi:uncharacterized protein (DUF58 family)
MTPNGRVVPLTWRLSRHARRLLTLAAAGVAFAVITGRAEFAGLAAPALLLLAGARSPRPKKITVGSSLSASRVFEGERVAIELSVSGQGEHTASWLLHPGDAVEVEAAPFSASRSTAEGTPATLVVIPQRWGRRSPGTVDLIVRDRWRVAEGHASVRLNTLDCYPHPAHQRDRVVLSRMPNRLGEHPVRVPGEGVEFAGVREYVPGDRQRQINWPASTRRGRLMVNTFAAERSQDVVLLVDTTSDVGEPGSSALDLALRGASAAARAYLEARDRVGVIVYQWGGSLWRTPGLGKRQQFRIVETMIAGDRGWGRGEPFRRLPRAALPDGALVIAFSPLLDERFTETLRDLRERGFAILVVDVLNASPRSRRTSVDHMARRLWHMEQEAIRFTLKELGIPVVSWAGTEPLDLPLAAYTRRPMVAGR